MEGKKSFILYADLISVVEKLSNEQAGILFKIIMDYVNDKNPDIKDLLMQIAFEPIKQQLKRDLMNWNDIRDERIKAGHLGGIKSGEARRKKANEASALKSKQKEANGAVNVTVTVNDTKEGKEYIPLLTEFLEQSEISCKKANLNFKQLKFAIESKYETWVADGWKDGHGKKIKNWKNKISNTLPFLKAIKQKTTTQYGTFN